jgi:hypothetical protein
MRIDSRHFNCVCLFFVEVGLELRASCLLKQLLYHLSHASSPFCSGSFGDRGLTICLG